MKSRKSFSDNVVQSSRSALSQPPPEITIPRYAFPFSLMKKALLILGIALVCSGCSGSDKKPIRIGFLGPLTGGAATYGMDAFNGIQIAVDEANFAGGIDGHTIELIAEDGGCTTESSLTAIEKLITIDQVVAILGGVCNPETLAASPFVESAKIPFISLLSSDASITNAGEYVFRMTPSDTVKGKTLAEFISAAGLQKIAIISENTSFPQVIRESVKNSLSESAELIADEVVPADTKNFSAIMDSLQKSDFDVLIANGQTDTTIAEIAQQLRARGMKQQIIGVDPADSDLLGAMFPEVVEGMKVLSLPTLNLSLPTTNHFAETFYKRFEEPKQSLYLAALSYDAANIMFDALDGPQEEAHRRLVTMKPYTGLVGTFEFDDNGDILGLPFGIRTFRGGELSIPETLPLSR